jgi:hypothetical protein
MKARLLLAWTFSGALAATSVNLDVLQAQQPPALTPPYKVTPLMKAPVTGEPNKETVMISVDCGPGARADQDTGCSMRSDAGMDGYRAIQPLTQTSHGEGRSGWQDRRPYNSWSRHGKVWALA